jgi:hypothetical protein
MTRDIEGDYKRAYIAEYEGYALAGRTDDAAAIAKILKDHYGHDVAPERADEQAPENTAEPAPKKGGRPKLPRDADGKIIR